jgi:glucose uptake protein GlcU
MEWILGFIAIALLIVGLVGQAFEMRKIRLANQDDLASANIFLNKKNFKWYVIIGVGMILWYAAERMISI